MPEKKVSILSKKLKEKLRPAGSAAVNSPTKKFSL